MSIINQFYQALQNNQPLTEFALTDMTLHVSYPINQIHGLEQLQSNYWQVLRQALADIERKPFIELTGEYHNQQWLAGTGYFIGNFTQDLLGIPATNQLLYLRFTELVQLTQGKIANYYLILDFLDVMNQAGVNPLRKSLGHEGLIMPPSSMDGLKPVGDLSRDHINQGNQTEQLVMDMLDELGRFDGKSLTSMALENYWHPDFMWYGPAGIGTTRGISGFRKFHQGPFVFSFPDRSIDHKATIIKQGNYLATGGWPHMHGTHLAGGWLGLPPSGKTLELRVMDIWRREGTKLKENWVAIDIIHMCKQMDLDLFDMMKMTYQLA